MNRNLRKAVAVSAVFAAALAGGLSSNAAAVAKTSQSAAKGGAITQFGYKANVFGTKVVVNGVELRNLKDALAVQKCTRQLRGETVKGSALGTDTLPIGNDLIRISPSTSKTLTYRAGDRYGVRGTNVIADIKVGGTIDVAGTPVSTPVLKIEGLTSVADSWNDTGANGGKGKFGHDESFGFGGISLEIPEGGPIPPEVQDLLDIIQDNLPITQTVNQIIDLLESVGTIEIPGLGTLALGHTTGKATNHYAEANAYALKIQVDNPQDGSKTVLQLGRATSKITDGVESGVFRSTMSALDLKIGDLVQFAGVSPQNIPCSGTNGNVKSQKVGAASVLGLVNLSNVKYSWMGKQQPKGKAKGFVQTEIGTVEIPAADIKIGGLLSRVNLKSKGLNKKVKRKVTTSLGSVTIAGTPVSLAPGQTYAFDGGTLRYQVIQNDDFYGTEVRALQITLFEQNVVLTLGQAAGRIFFK
ncbi:choice-of-anchor P family protein [Nocardioides dilutus]